MTNASTKTYKAICIPKHFYIRSIFTIFLSFQNCFRKRSKICEKLQIVTIFHNSFCKMHRVIKTEIHRNRFTYFHFSCTNPFYQFSSRIKNNIEIPENLRKIVFQNRFSCFQTLLYVWKLRNFCISLKIKT